METSILISLDGREDLANEIVDFINNYKVKNKVILDTVTTQKFSDGELCVDFDNSIRGKRVYILSSPNNSDEIMKLNLAIDAAKRAAAREIIPILPYFPYARQDKKDQKRGPIGAKVIVEMLEHRGATGVITFDLHADQIQGFFNIPVTHLEGKNIFDSYIASIYNEDTILCGPDAGSGKRVKRMKDQLSKYHDINLNYVMLDKTRKQANVIDEMIIIGDVTGKDVIILDDMVDTAGTLCKAAEVIMEAGAKSVRAIISHGICSGPALGRIEKSVLTELVISNSLKKPVDYNGMYSNNKLVVISMATQIGIAMSAINSKSSYEGLKKERW
jgi:ribose-phosphate pyrophosphokinase